MPTQTLGNADDRRWPPITADKQWLDRVTRTIIGAGMKVSRTLGVGFLEKVYENALGIQIRREGLQVEQQHPIHVYYEREIVGAYSADLLVESSVIVELKAQRALDEIHHLQCAHYLRATGLSVCLLMNFGRPRMEFRRIVNRF